MNESTITMILIMVMNNDAMTDFELHCSLLTYFSFPMQKQENEKIQNVQAKLQRERRVLQPRVAKTGKYGYEYGYCMDCMYSMWCELRVVFWPCGQRIQDIKRERKRRRLIFIFLKVVKKV